MKDEHNRDKQLIETALNNYARYWNGHDMDSWGELFTDDVDYINRNGGWWKNNKDNIAGHKQVHQMLIKSNQPKTFQLEIQKIDFLKPEIVIVQASSEWPDFKPINSVENAKNLKGIMTCVFVKKKGVWLIKTLHNTLIED